MGYFGGRVKAKGYGERGNSELGRLGVLVFIGG